MLEAVRLLNKGYYCKKDGNKLNDLKENRKGKCGIFNSWRICDECEYFGLVDDSVVNNE